MLMFLFSEGETVPIFLNNKENIVLMQTPVIKEQVTHANLGMRLSHLLLFPAKPWYPFKTSHKETNEKASYGNSPVSNVEVALVHNWGVVRAVQEFAAEMRASLHVTWLNQQEVGCYPIPAWYMVKP